MIGWDNSVGLSAFGLEALLLGVLFLVGFFVRRSSSVLRRYLIPTSLIAGFIGFALGPAVLAWVPFDTGRMGFYVYHLLALTFIAVGLRRPRGRATAAAFHVGFVKTVTVILQGLIGLGILFAFHAFVDRSVSPSVGMLLPLGFGMGPGIALSVGASWEAYGVSGAADAGLAIAAAGFVVAYGVGVWAVNRGVRDGLVTVGKLDPALRDAAKIEQEVVGEVADTAQTDAAPTGVSTPVALVALLAGIAVVYAATYGFMKLATAGMQRGGLAAEIPVLWSLNFLWANLIAMAFRRGLTRFRLAFLFDHWLIERAVAVFADLLVATAVMAIGLTLAPAYLLPLVLTCLVGAMVTYVVCYRTVRWAFDDHVFARFAGLFGEQTGTVSSGLALIRILDPGYATPVARDQVLGSGTALVLGFPLLLLINLPLTRFGGSGAGYALVAGLLVVYLIVAVVGWRVVRTRTRLG